MVSLLGDPGSLSPARAQNTGPSEAFITDQPSLADPQSSPGQFPGPVDRLRPAPLPRYLNDLSAAPGPTDLNPGQSDAPQPNPDLAQDFAQPPQQSSGSDILAQFDRSFAMIGDFSGRAASTVTLGNFIGIAAHHTTGAFSDNDLHLLVQQSGTNNATWVGGPGGLVAGSFLAPSFAPMTVPDPAENLTLNSTATGTYTAVPTADTIDVFDNLTGSGAVLNDTTVYNVYESYRVVLPGPNVADIVGRVRLQDNNSALPLDRVFLDYNFFHNVPLTADGINVNRWVPGFEKTVWGGLGSLEVRVPMGVTLATDSVAGVPIETSNPELGDMVLSHKLLLTSNEEYAIAIGMGVTLPTANDIVVSNGVGQALLRIETRSVHLIPYVACVRMPRGSSFYTQSFITLDVDTNGNPVQARLDDTGLQQIGVWNDQALLAFSSSLGYFVYENNSRNAELKTVALTAELHHTESIGDADTVDVGAFRIGNPLAELSLFNGTIGVHARFRQTTATVGYSVPLTSSDRLFDGEFRCFINRFF